MVWRVHLGRDPLGSANVQRTAGPRPCWTPYRRHGRIGNFLHRALAASAYNLPETDGADLPPSVCRGWLGHSHFWRTRELWVHKLVVIGNPVSSAAAIMDSG